MNTHNVKTTNNPTGYKAMKSPIASEMESNTEIKNRKGYMALRNNVYDLKLELWHVCKPLEYFLVDIIIDKTIKWRTKIARITIQEFSQRTRQSETHIYAALRNLKKKKIIIWTKENDISIYGLNEEYFGGLLIKRHEDALQERKKRIKIVVDNSKSTDEFRQSECPISSVKVTRSVSQSDEIRQSNTTHSDEIIEENGSLNTLLKDTLIKTSLKESFGTPEKGQKKGEISISTLGNGNGFMSQQETAKKQIEHEKNLRLQLEAMKAGREPWDIKSSVEFPNIRVC